MDISARSFLSFTASLTVASAIAIAPPPPPMPAIPTPTVADVRLTASPAEIEAAIARFQGVFDDLSAGAGELAGLPGRGLIAAAGGIENFFDVALTRLIDDATDPDAATSLTILRTLAVNAWAMLEHNLGRINPVITYTTEQVGKLLSGAVTGSAQNMLIALSELAGHPLALQSYAHLFTAALDSGRLVVGNGLRVIHEIGGAGLDIAQVVVDELTYQVDNLIGGFSTLLTHIGDTSASPLVAAALGAVRDLVLAPVRAVVDAGSRVISTVVTITHTGFDRVLDTATDIVDPPRRETAPVVTAARSESESAAVDPAGAPAHADGDAATEAPVDEKPAVEAPVDDEPAVEAPVDSAEPADPAESAEPAESADPVDSEETADSDASAEPADSDDEAPAPRTHTTPRADRDSAPSGSDSAPTGGDSAPSGSDSAAA